MLLLPDFVSVPDLLGWHLSDLTAVVVNSQRMQLELRCVS